MFSISPAEARVFGFILITGLITCFLALFAVGGFVGFLLFEGLKAVFG